MILVSATNAYQGFISLFGRISVASASDIWFPRLHSYLLLLFDGHGWPFWWEGLELFHLGVQLLSRSDVALNYCAHGTRVTDKDSRFRSLVCLVIIRNHGTCKTHARTAMLICHKVWRCRLLVAQMHSDVVGANIKRDSLGTTTCIQLKLHDNPQEVPVVRPSFHLGLTRPYPLSNLSVRTLQRAIDSEATPTAVQCVLDKLR